MIITYEFLNTLFAKTGNLAGIPSCKEQGSQYGHYQISDFWVRSAGVWGRSNSGHRTVIIYWCLIQALGPH